MMHTHGSVPLLILMVVLPLLFVGLAIPMVRGSVKPNPLYGVRTRKTLASQELWYRSNRAAGYGMIVGTAASVMLWAAMALIPMNARLRYACDLNILAAGAAGCMLAAAYREGAF